MGRPVGELLYKMRTEVDKPIAAILTLNTVANTAGSTIAGAAFLAVFGAEHMALFALAFTVVILAFGEIVPKTLGVAYATPLASALARPLALTIKLLSPLLHRLFYAQSGFDRLCEVQNRISLEIHQNYIGKTMLVLVDGKDGDQLTARTEGGRLVRMHGDDELIGQFVHAKITGCTTWSLVGELAE